jgi:hypothetical protein
VQVDDSRMNPLEQVKQEVADVQVVQEGSQEEHFELEESANLP